MLKFNTQDRHCCAQHRRVTIPRKLRLLMQCRHRHRDGRERCSEKEEAGQSHHTQARAALGVLERNSWFWPMSEDGKWRQEKRMRKWRRAFSILKKRWVDISSQASHSPSTWYRPSCPVWCQEPIHDVYYRSARRESLRSRTIHTRNNVNFRVDWKKVRMTKALLRQSVSLATWCRKSSCLYPKWGEVFVNSKAHSRCKEM